MFGRLLFLFTIWGHCWSQPLKAQDASNSSSDFVGYIPDPNGRGTPTLVLSCVLTLVLCVWSALHLNVPAPGTTPRQTIWTSVVWILAGIYAPELVAFAAWRQWSSANILSRIVNQSLPAKAISGRKHSWTTTHSFFASTGGFAFDCTPYLSNRKLHEGFLPKGTPNRLTVSARGMAFLAKIGRLPDLPREDIEDKSKANALAKVLVLLQAAWMLCQVVGRLIAGLPVTLLEVNTVAHVLCAFAMYAMWWNKPFAPNEPILITGEWVPEVLAFMYMSSEVSGVVDDKHIKSETIVKTLFASLNLYSKTPELEYVCIRQTKRDDEEIEKNTAEERAQPEEHRRINKMCQINTEQCRELRRAHRLVKTTDTAFFERRPRVRSETSVHLSVDESVRRRRGLFTAALTKYDITAEQLQVKHAADDATVCCSHYKPEEFLTHFSRNWPSDELIREVGGLVVGMVLWLANFLYGGIHAAAWNEHFPSTIEKWLWRASASYIGFCGGLWVVLNFAVSSYPPLNEFWERWMDGEKTWVHNISLGVPVVVCGFSLIFARAYIVIEAFVSIRELPASAYQTPDWTQIFPHL